MERLAKSAAISFKNSSVRYYRECGGLSDKGAPPLSLVFMSRKFRSEHGVFIYAFNWN